MDDEKTTRSQAIINKLKNNPLIATIIAIGFIVTITNPLFDGIGKISDLFKEDLSQSQRRITTLKSDHDKILIPIRHALDENKAQFDRLKSPLYQEPGWGIQESYYERVRRDGRDKHQLMKKLIDSLIFNNDKIVNLLDKYTGRARTDFFKEQAKLFREHASLYKSRWAGMTDAAEAGELQPIAEPVFPSKFPPSLEKEIGEIERLIRKESGH